MAKTEKKGVLKTWKDDRGFGFIKQYDGSDDLFIHISALEGVKRRPYRGDIIFYQVENSANGKSKAINASIEGVEAIDASLNDNTSSNKWPWVVAGIVLGSAIVAVTAGFLV